MSNQNFHTPNNVIEPYQYDIALNYIEAYQPSTQINNLIETYLILKLIGSIISVVGKTTVEIIELFECTQKVP